MFLRSKLFIWDAAHAPRGLHSHTPAQQLTRPRSTSYLMRHHAGTCLVDSGDSSFVLPLLGSLELLKLFVSSVDVDASSTNVRQTHGGGQDEPTDDDAVANVE